VDADEDNEAERVSQSEICFRRSGVQISLSPTNQIKWLSDRTPAATAIWDAKGTHRGWCRRGV
jgi:hypothetical protein